MNDRHRKKMTAPIIITVVFTALFLCYAILYFSLDELPLAVKAIFGGLMIALAAAMIYVLMERIREIKGGEEDDLDNY